MCLTILAACGTDPPTAVVNPPVTPPPPADNVNWVALADLYHDPLYPRMPQLLEDQQAALPMKNAVASLAAAVVDENLDMVHQELTEVALERDAYVARPGFDAGDRPLIATMMLFELRGKGYVPAASQASITTQPEGGNR